MAKVTAYTGGELVRIPLSRILVHDDLPNARPIDKDWVRDLSANIERDGLDTPIVVWNGGGDGELAELKGGKVVPGSFLVAGFHRVEAIKALKRRNEARYAELFSEGIPAIVRAGDIKDVLLAQLRENITRKDMDQSEVLTALQKLRDEHKMKQKVLARELGKSEAWISSIFDIEENLGEEGVEAVKKKEVTLRGAIKAAKDVKAAKKAGKAVDKGEVLAKAKAKAAKSKNGKSERRLSAVKLLERYRKMPKASLATRVEVLTETLEYLAGESEAIPSALDVDSSEE